MKKVLGLLVFIFLLSGCDDGELTVATADFGDIDPKLCSNNPSVMYKINENDTESMILIIPSTLNPYPNIVDTQTFAIGSIAEVIYRRYDGAINSDNICQTIQPGSPSLAEEWIATSGTVSITTKPILSPPDEETEATTIIRYEHKIEFINIAFAKSDGSNQIYENLLYGYYTTNGTSPQFTFEDELQKCTSNNTVYKIDELGARKSLIIKNIDPTLIPNVEGERIGYVGLETNVLVYQSYLTDLPLDPADYFCATTTPSTPLVGESWSGVPGNESIGTGIIHVQTVANSTNGFTHIITLQKVTFYNAVSKSSFYYGNEILYGNLISN